MSSDASLEVLIQIREELAGLNRTKVSLKETKQEASELGTILRQGFGIGTGMEIARRSIDFLRNSLSQTVGESIRMADATRTQSRALGLTAEAYQVLTRELVDNNVAAERLGDAFQSQADRMTEARNGAASAIAVYKALGLEVSDLERLNPEQQMLAVAKAALESTDRTKAFHAAGQILGSGGVQQLVNALRRLATEGYAPVTEQLKAANEVMSEDAIERIGRMAKAWERLQRSASVAAGETLAKVHRIGESFGNAPRETLAGLAEAYYMGNMKGLDAVLARNTESLKPTTPEEPVTPPAQEQLQLLEELRAAEADYALSVADTTRTELARRGEIVAALESQQDALKGLLALIDPGKEGVEQLKKAFDEGTITDAQLNRLREYAQLTEQISQATNAIAAARGEAPSYLDELRERANGRNDPTVNPRAMSAGEGVQAGALQWIISLGSTGEQVASVMEGSLGLTLDSIAGKLAGNDVRDWGDVWKGVLAQVGQQVIALILQMQMLKLLGLFGLGTGTAGAGAGGGVATLPSLPSLGGSYAGGGSFMTRGPTSIIVGDNPGGIEHVSVTPISGVGQTRLTNNVIAMAGGGTALAMGSGVGGGSGGQGAVVVHQTLNISTGVQETVRAEIFGLMPTLRQASTQAIMDAMARNEIDF